jgi:hypothetical protein
MSVHSRKDQEDRSSIPRLAEHRRFSARPALHRWRPEVSGAWSTIAVLDPLKTGAWWRSGRPSRPDGRPALRREAPPAGDAQVHEPTGAPGLNAASDSMRVVEGRVDRGSDRPVNRHVHGTPRRRSMSAERAK